MCATYDGAKGEELEPYFVCALRPLVSVYLCCANAAAERQLDPNFKRVKVVGHHWLDTKGRQSYTYTYTSRLYFFFAYQRTVSAYKRVCFCSMGSFRKTLSNIAHARTSPTMFSLLRRSRTCDSICRIARCRTTWACRPTQCARRRGAGDGSQGGRRRGGPQYWRHSHK